MSPAPGGPARSGQELPQLTPGQAFWRGLVTALILVVPAAVLNELIARNNTTDGVSPFAMLMWAVILLGGGAGGWAVIRLCQMAPLSYSAGAGAAAYALVQGFGIIRRLIAGDPIPWIGYPFLALLMATCGMLGGMFARRWMSQNQGES